MNTQLHFLPWGHILDDAFANIDKFPEEIRDQTHKFDKGQTCASWLPKDLHFKMDPSFGRAVTDALQNNLQLILCSEKLKALLQTSLEQANIVDDIEFIPITIDDIQDNPIKETYYIANVLRVVSCMDKEKSVFEMSAMAKTQVHHFKHLYLEQEKIPDDALIFRLEEKKNVILIRNDLAMQIKKAGISGVEFAPLEDFGKQYRPVDRLALAKAMMQQQNK